VTVADRRETILRGIYEVNRQTIEDGRKNSPSSILVPDTQHDAREADARYCRRNAALLARPIAIHVLDIDPAGPRFGAAALAASTRMCVPSLRRRFVGAIHSR